MFTPYIGLGSSTAGKPYLIGPYNNKNAMSDFVDKWKITIFVSKTITTMKKYYLPVG